MLTLPRLPIQFLKNPLKNNAEGDDELSFPFNLSARRGDQEAGRYSPESGVSLDTASPRNHSNLSSSDSIAPDFVLSASDLKLREAMKQRELLYQWSNYSKISGCIPFNPFFPTTPPLSTLHPTLKPYVIGSANASFLQDSVSLFNPPNFFNTPLPPSSSSFPLTSNPTLGTISQRREKRNIERRFINKPNSAPEQPVEVNNSESESSLSENNEHHNQDYIEKRRKNNLAAKRSRDSRRAKEEVTLVRVHYFEQENQKLRERLRRLTDSLERLQTFRDHLELQRSASYETLLNLFRTYQENEEAQR